MTPLEKICSPFPNEHRAITWLYGFTSQHDWITMESENATCKNPDGFPVVDFRIELNAKSRRRYKIVGRIIQTEWELAKIQPTEVSGTSSEENEELGGEGWCQLCISSSENGELLPIGDQLISMVLAMHDDISLAQQIPLLELFLVHEQKEHQWIQAYLSDGIVLEQNDPDLYQMIPDEIRYLDHHFSCMEDGLQYTEFTEEDRQAIFDDEIRIQSQKIREKKQNQQ